MGVVGGRSGRVGAACAVALALLLGPDARAAGGYEQALLAARMAVKARRFDRAEVACKEALRGTGEPWSGGPRTADAASLCAEIELERGGFRAAARWFREASQATMHDWDLRRQVLVHRRSAAASGGDGRHVDLVDRLIVADAAVQRALARPDRQGQGLAGLVDELGAAEGTYAEDRDRAFGALARAARALVLARSGRALETLAVADPLVAADQPPRVREAALEAVFLARLAGQDVEGLARAAVLLDSLRRAPLAPEDRAHARSPELEAACALHDARHGRGSCTRLELSLTGAASFTDWSRGWRPRLSRDDIELVHRQGFPALEACVLARAKADVAAFRRAEVEVSWNIAPSGLPVDVGVVPGRLSRALEPCVEDVVGRFRYPRSPQPEQARIRVPYRFE